MWVEAGFLKESELLSLCHVDSSVEGHPMPVRVAAPAEPEQMIPNASFVVVCCLCRVPLQKQHFVELATGSLGQGLGVACGMAYTGKYFDKAR